MRKIASLLSVLMLLCALAFAQTTRTVAGRVTDDQGAPVPFATVTETGNNKNVVTADAGGNFSIKIKDGSQLTITSAGFEPQTTTPVGGTASISLKSTGEMKEVVVTTALGVQRQKKELGYATAKVDNKELTQARPVSVATGLQGKVSGLNVASINNGVFSDVKINLRGLRSLTGDNNPLFLLDGVATPIGYLSQINPNDILDVNIIKGTSGAAVYGPDGRNGVIIVTTKRGTRDGKPIIMVSQTTTLEKVAYLPKFQTRFGSGSSVDQFGNGVYDPIENQQYGPEFDGSVINLGPGLEDGTTQQVTYVPRPDEKKKFWNTGVSQQSDVSFQAQNFFMSLQHVDVNGVVPEDEMKRSAFRFNSAKEYGKFKIGFNLAYTQQNYNVVNQGAGGDIQWLVFNTPMHVPLTQYRNWRTDKYAMFSNYYNEYYPNPYYVIDNYRTKGREDDVLANTELNFKATNWLSFTHRAAISAAFGESKSTSAALFVTQYAKDHRDNTLYKDVFAQVSDGQSRGSRITSELFGTVNKTFNDFRVLVNAGHYFRQSESKGVSVSGSNLVVPTLFNVSNRTGELGGSESNSKTRLWSLFGSAAITYKSWATIEFAGRNDWVSVLSPENNSYFYPGVNASLVLSDAIPAIKGSSFISYLKLRGSVNKSGSINIGAYALESTFSQAGGFPYGSLPGFTANNSSPDPNLEPEFIENIEIGAEFGFLKNRINLEVAAYKQDNNNQVISVATSSATGYTSTLVNAASFENKGIEIDLRITPIVKFRKGSVEFRSNFSINDSKITELYQDVGELFIGGFTGGSVAANWAIVGQPAYVLKGLDYNRDPQGRVIIDPISGYPSLNAVPDTFGRTTPKFVWGLSPSLNWNGLSFSVVAEYKGGHYAYHGIGPDMDFTGISARSARNGRQRFVFPNSSYWDGTKYVENTNITVANGGYNFYTSQPYNRNVATNYITSAAAWRIREIALGYDLPMQWLGGQNVIKKINLSVFGRNVQSWLPKSNEWTDPDFNFTSGNATGINSSSISPPTRIFGGSLSITF